MTSFAAAIRQMEEDGEGRLGAREQQYEALSALPLPHAAPSLAPTSVLLHAARSAATAAEPFVH